jgi:hypothetical protein
MLRNRCGWAWRLFVAFMLFSVFQCPVARGGPLTGLPPILPVIPTKSGSGSQTLFSLSGYVYQDPTGQGIMQPGGLGVPAVEMLLLNSSGGTAEVAFTNTAGYYYFGGLLASQPYTIEEMPPTNYVSTVDNVGYFQLSSGGTLSAPPGAAYGMLSPPYSISGITFAASSSGSYSAVQYDFGESPQTFHTGIPSKPTIPGGVGATGPSASFSVSLAVVGGNNRFLAASSGAGILQMSGTVLNTATSAADAISWSTLQTSTGLTMSPTGTSNLAAGAASLLTGTLNGTNLSSGTQTAYLEATGRIGATGKVTNNTGAVIVDPVNSRGIDFVSTANLGRIMAGTTTAPAGISITSAGAYLNYSNLTLNTASAAGSDANGAFTVSNTGAAVTYNGTTTSNPAGTSITATFSGTASGTISGVAPIAGNTGLFTGETLASGTPVLPTLSVPYTATVLQQRQLAPGPAVTLPVPAGFGGLLSGATVNTGVSVTSTTDSSHTTSVYVYGSALALYSSDGVSVYQPPDQVGQVTATQTLVNSAGTTNVPVSVLVQGLGTQYSAIAALSVKTAESLSVGDTASYAPVNVAYNVSNVGLAATGGTATSGGKVVQTYGAPLSAPVAQGTALATFNPTLAQGGNYTGVTLTSLVYAIGTAGSSSTALNSPDTNTIISSGAVTSSNVYGVVGSQCDILDSTALSSSSTVTMAWRARNSNENGITGVHQPIFPQGIWNLSSDVVDIENVPSATSFAMEMSFQDDINTALDGGLPSTVAGTYLAKWNPSAGTAGQWVNAASTVTPGSLAVTGVADTLSDFLAQEYAAHPGIPHDQLLADLVGSWGVAFNTNPSTPGVGTSWAIVNNGDGQFAVVPEPSTLALLGASLAGFLAYRFRRKASLLFRRTSMTPCFASQSEA